MDFYFTELFEELKVPLRSFISRRVANKEDADDILQDVFVKLLNNDDKLTGNPKINALIYKITRNAVIDYYRRNNKHIEAGSLPEELPAVEDEDASSNEEMACCLKDMVESLPEKYKQAIILTAFENHTIKQYSEIAGISLSGAKSRVQRARRMLKEMILECCSLKFDRLGNIIDYRERNESK